jgi:predicted O-methyltransferase YrrM
MKSIRRWISAKTESSADSATPALPDANRPVLPDYPADFTHATRSLPEANKWILSEFILDKLVPVIGVHPYPLDELLFMCSTVAYFHPDIIIEWGTHLGKSARIFYETSVYLRLGNIVHSIDLPPENEHMENIHETSERAMFVRGLPVKLHIGDGLSIARDLLAETKPNLPLLFVDGDHSIESVQYELAYIKQIAPRAVVLAHDTFFQGPESGYNCGPYEAMKKFADECNLPIESTVLGLPGMSLTYWL